MLEQASRRRRANTARSQLATELLMLTYSLVAAAILFRTVLVVFGVSKRVWLGDFVYGLIAPVTEVLATFPGASEVVLGRLTLMDVTLLAIVVLFPLGVIATGGKERH
jgi:hypothetical protein